MIKYTKKIIFSLLAMLFVLTSTAFAAEVSAVRWSNYKNPSTAATGTRIVLDLTDLPKVTSSFKKGTLIVNLLDVQPGKQAGVLAIKTGNVKNVLSYKSANSTQIKISLDESITKDALRVFTLRKDNIAGRPNRLVIDVFDNKPVIAKLPLVNSSKPSKPNVKGGRSNDDAEAVSPLYKKYVLDPKAKATPGLAGRTIVLDPGHGGSDPGAIGLSGNREKDINLKVSKKVMLLLAQSKANVRMTRTTDIDVIGSNATDVQDLQYRVDVGTNARADIFVSIHSNSSPNRSVTGTTTYYYAKTPKDELLAKCVQDKLVEYGNLDNLGVRTAGFYVIKRSKIPAILIELGFISNQREEALLASPAMQDKLAYGIVSGIEDYFKIVVGGK